MIFSDIWGPPKVLALARSISYTCTEHCLNGGLIAHIIKFLPQSDSVIPLCCAIKFSVTPTHSVVRQQQALIILCFSKIHRIKASKKPADKQKNDWYADCVIAIVFQLK